MSLAFDSKNSANCIDFVQALSNETLRLEKAEQQKTDHEYKLRTLVEKFDTC